MKIEGNEDFLGQPSAPFTVSQSAEKNRLEHHMKIEDLKAG